MAQSACSISAQSGSNHPTTAKLFIGGKFVESQTKEWRDIINPATQEVIGRVPFCTQGEVDAAVAAAKEAFKSWKSTPIGARARIFLKYQQLIRENIKDVAKILTAEQGKTLVFNRSRNVFFGGTSCKTQI